MLRLYQYQPSGNCYKIRLLLAHLGLPYEIVEKDILKGETRTPEFLAINANGRIPVLQLESGEDLTESNAILCYLAEGTPWLPDDRLERARLLSFLFWEQYSHEPNIATVRFWLAYKKVGEEYRERITEKQRLGYVALDLMEKHLSTHHFFVGERFTLADIALFAYTHVAPEGGFDLEPYPAIRAWINRVKDQPGHVSITG